MKIKDVILNEMLKVQIKKATKSIQEEISRKQRHMEMQLVNEKDIEKIGCLQAEYKELSKISSSLYEDESGEFDLDDLKKFDIRYAEYSVREAIQHKESIKNLSKLN